ncbi:HAD family hydrolase [Consotaella aegiceratis]|uniref:HAD family hydrolase n=1 Tax=Consotaella aegiceratis TaxID=3097961 RepID=UPI002F3F5D9A
MNLLDTGKERNDPWHRPDAVLWDCDGVLIDSEPLHYEAIRTVTAGRGVTLSPQENTALLGASLPTVWQFLARSGLAMPLGEWIAAIEDHYLSRLHPGLARPEALAMILRLDAEQCPQARVSTAERHIHRANLDALGVLAAFRVIISREDVARTKPDPDPYREACARLGAGTARP